MTSRRVFLERLALMCAAACAGSSSVSAKSTRRRKQWLALWQGFAAGAVHNGRVIDVSDKRLITTSEGQSYAMFFSLVAGDRALFDALWQWTQNNLCAGDCGKTLPAWLWGRLSDTRNPKTRRLEEHWDVIDDNNAVDADLWIAYSLLEASRLWRVDDYRTQALSLLELVKQQCVRTVGTLGSVCLPAKRGFQHEDGSVTLNPSYYPLQLMQRFCREDAAWQGIARSTLRALLRSSPTGIVPDWARFNARGLLLATDRDSGSWDAIRTYMWAGMLASDVPERAMLLERFQNAYGFVKARMGPIGRVNAPRLSVGSPGPDAFVAAFLSWNPQSSEAAMMRSLLESVPIDAQNYYKSMLTLFGRGFDDGCFAFDRYGRLLLATSGKEA